LSAPCGFFLCRRHKRKNQSGKDVFYRLPSTLSPLFEKGKGIGDVKGLGKFCLMAGATRAAN